MTRMICPVPGCVRVQHEGARICLDDFEDLVPASEEEPAQPTDEADLLDAAQLAAAAQPTAVAQPASRVRLSLEFPHGQVTVAAGERIPLGRSAAESPHAGLLSGHRNVSRLHATAGVDQNIGAWIQDERSTNGTFVNGQDIRAQVQWPLMDGDRLRFGADLTAEVRIAEEPPKAG
jgi:pSer/pThr/pTyr-binding forkhead associated (FHA) protein